MMRVILANALAFVVCAFPAVLDACSCAPPPPPKEALAASGAVFSGKVVAIEDVGDFDRQITMEVSHSWKGVDGKTVTVRTARDSAACGVAFAKGKAYLVYASHLRRGKEMVLSTNLCTRTKLLDSAKDDLDALGKANAPK